MLRIFFIVLVATAAGPIQAEETLADHMNEHFARASEAQAAIVAGDLERARKAAGWLADHPAADAFPDNAVDEMRAAAQQVVAASDVVDAALGVGRIGAACGHCHSLMGVDPGLDSSVEIDVGDSLPARMARHRWATDRMWEGLINPSDQAWSYGAEALLESPLTGEAVQGHAQPAIDLIGQRVHDLAARAGSVYDRERRAEIYGAVLSQCASCHKGFRAR